MKSDEDRADAVDFEGDDDEDNRRNRDEEDDEEEDDEDNPRRKKARIDDRENEDSDSKADEQQDDAEERVARLKKLFVKVGDGAVKPSGKETLISHLLGLKLALESDLEAHGDVISSCLVECGCNFGWKACVYGTLTGLLPEKVQDQVLEEVKTRIGRTLANPSFKRESSLVLRFVVELANAKVISHNSCCKMMEALIEKGHSMLVMRLLPWFHGVGQDTVSKLEQALVEDQLEVFHSYMKPLMVSEGDGEDSSTTSPEDGTICRPYLFEKVHEALVKREVDFEAEVEEISHDRALEMEKFVYLNHLQEAGFAMEKHVEKHPNRKREIHGAQQSREVSGLESALELFKDIPKPTLFLYRQYVEEILGAYFPLPRDAEEAMREFSKDEEKSRYLLIECLFATVVTDPSRAFFATRMMAYMFHKEGPRRRTFLNAIDDTIDGVMLLLPRFSIVEQDRLAQWMSTVLVLKGSHWDWHKWIEILDTKKDTVRYPFLVQVLERVVSMTAREGLLDLGPGIVKQFIPAQDEPNVGVENITESMVSDLIEVIKDKADQNRVKLFFQDKAAQLSDQEKLDYLLQATMLRGRFSLSLTRKTLEYFTFPSIETLFPDDEASELDWITPVTRFWTSSPQIYTKILLHLVDRKRIPAVKLCNYVLLDHTKFLESWSVYSMLKTLVEHYDDEDQTIRKLVSNTATKQESPIKQRLEAIL